MGDPSRSRRAGAKIGCRIRGLEGRAFRSEEKVCRGRPLGDPATGGSNGDQALVTSLTGLIRPQPQTTVLPGTPDRDFTQRRNVALMWLIATMLTFEWITRRLHRLA